MKSALLDVPLYLHAETEKAIKVSEDGDAEFAVWLPKSQIEIHPGSSASEIEVTMPEWLAEEKGFN